MLNLTCSICSDSFAQTDDVSVTKCGHMFHCTCLLQWLERSQTCPQCRQKCSERNLIRLYMNVDNINASHIDVSALKDSLDNAKLQVRLKAQELQKANNEIQTLKEKQKISTNTIKALDLTVKQNNAIILGYCEQMKNLQIEIKLNEDLRKEIRRLNLKITEMELVQEIMNASAAEAESLLKNENDPKILSIWVATLKRELRLCEMKKNDMRNALKAAQNDLRKELAIKKAHQERISELESEIYQLHEKNKSLQGIVNNNNQPISNNNEKNMAVESSSTVTNSTTANPTESEPAAAAATAAVAVAITTATTTLTTVRQVENTIKNAEPVIASPGLSECMRQIEESNSPYLNIKSSNIGITAFMKISNCNDNQHPAAAKFPNIKFSTIQHPVAAITSTKPNQQYSILKRPRLMFTTNTANSTTTSQQLNQNYALNGTNNICQQGSTSNQPIEANTTGVTVTIASTTVTKATSNSINKRLRSGYLRDFKLSK